MFTAQSPIMKILILPGDGIGPEIVGRAVRVLENSRRRGADRAVARSARRRGARRHGHPIPEVTQQQARAADAILLGCVGGPVRHAAARGTSEQGLLGIRQDLKLFANLRPAMLYPELAASSSLKPEVVAGLDIMIIRELTGDIYFGQPRGRRQCSGRGRRLRHHALREERGGAHRTSVSARR